MRLGACPRCGAPYSAAEVAGLGILRARPAKDGGPRVEYRCAACRRVIVLVPHGEGRYAPPGAPPPEAVPAQARRPSWVGAEGAEPPGRPPPGQGADPSPPAGSAGPGPGPAGEPRSDRRRGRAPAQAPDGEHGVVLELAEALELLGVGPAASREELERAYRTRSLTCHPDKVAHLDPEFLALATRKFQRLNEAYRLLLGEPP